MFNFIDRISDALGWLAGWMYFAIGIVISYDVTARYLFNAPTKWGLEVSEFLQLWATYLAAAYVLRHRQLISITLVTSRLGPIGRRVAEGISLLSIIGFCLVAIIYGMDILMDSIALGRRTSTMLSVPKWMTESAIPLGFGLLCLQAVVEFIRLLQGAEPDKGRIEEQL